MELQKILKKFDIGCDIRTILDKWNEPHRIYHNLDHLYDLISKINDDYGFGNFGENERDKLIVTALFHDVIFDPESKNNEENSADFFFKLCREKHDIDVVEIKQMILDTKSCVGSTPLSEIFIKYDMSIMEGGLNDLIQWENNLRGEYSFVSDDGYKFERIDYLEKMIDKFPTNMDNILDLINYVKTKYV